MPGGEWLQLCGNRSVLGACLREQLPSEQDLTKVIDAVRAADYTDREQRTTADGVCAIPVDA
jgi:hypothetical protein